MPQEKIAHCVICHKPVLNQGIFEVNSSFQMRCPWCQTTLKITIVPQLIVQAMENLAILETNKFNNAENYMPP